MGANTINYNEEVLKGGFIVSGVSILLTMIIYIIDIEMLVSGWFGFVYFGNYTLYFQIIFTHFKKFEQI